VERHREGELRAGQIDRIQATPLNCAAYSMRCDPAHCGNRALRSSRKEPALLPHVVQVRGTTMAKTLEGSCRCGAVHFSVESHTPYPYQLCYCSICRKTAGGGGFAINLMGDADTLKMRGRRHVGFFRARIEDETGHCHTSTGQRHFCKKCGSALWLFDPHWPQLVHPSLRPSTRSCQCRRQRCI
jgi:hypothetical protein